LLLECNAGKSFNRWEFGRIGEAIGRTVGSGGGMNSKTVERSALVPLVAYCLDLAWKLVNWGEFSRGLDWWMIAMALTVRFAFMGGLLFLFIRVRKARKSGASF
jgi:hypothetical protein